MINKGMIISNKGKYKINQETINNCGKKIKYKLYVEYLNYTLKDLIEHRNKQR